LCRYLLISTFWGGTPFFTSQKPWGSKGLIYEIDSNYILNNSNEDQNQDLDSESILMQLLPKFQSSKEIYPTWFIEQISIKYLKEKFNVKEEEAFAIFEKIKASLFELLDVQEEIPKPIDDNIERLAKLKEIQKKYKR